MRTRPTALYAAPGVTDSVYHTAVQFSQRYHANPPSGLLIVTGDHPFLDELFDWNENGELFRRYKGIQVQDQRMERLLHRMRDRDGAVVFGPDGELLGAELTVQGVTTRDIGETMKYVCGLFGDPERTAHTRHSAGAYASLLHSPAVTVSGTNGLVVAFEEGQVRRHYRPQTREDVDVNELSV